MRGGGRGGAGRWGVGVGVGGVVGRVRRAGRHAGSQQDAHPPPAGRHHRCTRRRLASRGRSPPERAAAGMVGRGGARRRREGRGRRVGVGAAGPPHRHRLARAARDGRAARPRARPSSTHAHRVMAANVPSSFSFMPQVVNVLRLWFPTFYKWLLSYFRDFYLVSEIYCSLSLFSLII